jgi:hypothetical protein
VLSRHGSPLSLIVSLVIVAVGWRYTDNRPNETVKIVRAAATDVLTACHARRKPACGRLVTALRRRRLCRSTVEDHLTPSRNDRYLVVTVRH